MLPELLLLFSCINNTGCTNTFQQYRAYNPTLVRNIEENVNEQLKRTPESVKLYVLPFAALAGGGTASLGINKNTILTINSQKAALTITWPLN